jgi:hypothetical protein
MPDQILDGSGQSNRAKVDANLRLRTQNIQESEAEHAAEIGNAYNINTGLISLTGASDSALLYLKNLEDKEYILDALALGVGKADGTSDLGYVTLIQNPTAGDLITDATAVSINANRSAGSGNTLNANVYKGKDGGTVTGGTDVALFAQGSSGRLFASFTIVVPKNQSIAVKYDPNLSSGSVNVYAAFIGHLKDSNSKD